MAGLHKFVCLAIAFGLLTCAGFAAGYTDIAVSQRGGLDFPAARCGGHAHTGVRWTAPKPATINIRGYAWKIRSRPGADTLLSLWINRRKLVDRFVVRGTSDAPYLLARMVADQGGDPKILQNVSVRSGDEIYVQIDGNDFTGLGLSIRGENDAWDLAADFSQKSNPNGPWTYGEVVLDEAGNPRLNPFETLAPDFDPDDFGPGQPAWHSAKLPWYYSIIKSTGTAPRRPEVRYTSDQVVHVEGLLNDRWVGRYWSANGRINLPHEVGADDAFQVAIDNEPLTGGWKLVSARELDRSDRGARHFVVELSNANRPITVRVHTLIDGTPVLTRWLEITNRTEKPVALTTVAPWSGRLIIRRNESPGEATLGSFTRQDWAAEGWFQWQRLEKGVKTLSCDQARSHDDPFFILRNDANGEYFIGQLAWTTQWQMQFERNDSGVLFRIGPWAENAALRVIAPGETLATPEVHLGHVSGGLDTAIQAMHDHIRRFVLPARPPERSQLIQYLVPADQGYYVPFDEASALKCVDVAAAIGAELFILDYGWWDVELDWVPSSSRFPRGLKPLVDYVHKKNMLFGLYVRTEGDSGDVPLSKVAKKHPDWIGPSNTVNLQIPEAAAWVESEICRLVDEHSLDLYRLDYNPAFKFGTTPHDGLTENNAWRYYEAFYGLYQRIHKKYPNLILQQAAAGGGRNDLGTCSRFHEPYLTDGLWIPRELQVYSGLTLGLPPENFVILHLAHGGGGGMGLPQALDTILRMSYAAATPQIFVGIVAPSVETLAPERRDRFLHYGQIYKQFIRPLLPTCKIYHHEPISSRGGVASSGWFVMEYAAPDRSKGWALLVRIGQTDSDTYVFRPRGLDPGKTYRVTFDSLNTTATVEGLPLVRDGLPIRLENMGTSELLLFERPGPPHVAQSQ